MRMWRERTLIVLVFLLHQIDGEDGCPVSSCGKITNISYPFRLKGDPKVCGRYELYCENNITVLSLLSGTFRVEAINYNNFTIRVVDPGLQPTNCSSLPRYSLSPYNFTYLYTSVTDFDDFEYAFSPFNRCYNWYVDGDKFLFEYIAFLDCSHGVSGNSKYVDTGGCVNWESKGYIYAMAVGDLLAEDIEVGCRVKLVAPTSWWGLDTNKYSYAFIHKALLYGFQLSWTPLACAHHCGAPQRCSFNYSSHTFQCIDRKASRLLYSSEADVVGSLCLGSLRTNVEWVYYLCCCSKPRQSEHSKIHFGNLYCFGSLLVDVVLHRCSLSPLWFSSRNVLFSSSLLCGGFTRRGKHPSSSFSFLLVSFRLAVREARTSFSSSPTLVHVSHGEKTPFRFSMLVRLCKKGGDFDNLGAS
ncbi:hypothetical protein V8G54_035223 [Vigna mungo]|uniref:Wall-associated receptor kinase galacturonan-binding domain-containing protein n=1 Tax=Vigna mungo TaxID=3915 RepID=A0AAQ3MEL9_VIGMU